MGRDGEQGEQGHCGRRGGADSRRREHQEGEHQQRHQQQRRWCREERCSASRGCRSPCSSSWLAVVVVVVALAAATSWTAAAASFAGARRASSAFVATAASGRNRETMTTTTTTRLRADPSSDGRSTTAAAAAPAPSSSSPFPVNGEAGGLVSSSGGGDRSQLFSSFSALSARDQYDAVLTGLCAKILDSPGGGFGSVDALIRDPVQLLVEMNQQSIPVSTRSLMALIDSAVKTQNVRTINHVMTLCQKSRGGGGGVAGNLARGLFGGGRGGPSGGASSESVAVTRYGADQSDVLLYPAQPAATVVCRDGARRTRTERIRLALSGRDGGGGDDNGRDRKSVIPSDNRAQEIASAMAVLAVGGTCGIVDVTNYDGELALYANVLLTTMLTVGAVDNFYDVIKFGANFVGQQVSNLSSGKDDGNKKNGGDKKNNKKFEVPLPKKSDLPLGLGTGKVTGTVVRGLSRLTTIDAERESLCEAAALYSAYVLGLPCYSYRPNAFEASVMVVESCLEQQAAAAATQQQQPQQQRRQQYPPPLNTSFLSNSGIVRILIWLLSPVVMESSKYAATCIMSDPRESYDFLQRLEQYASKNPSVINTYEGDLFWVHEGETDAERERERQDLLQWSYLEADALIRDNRRVIEDISRRLSGGAATIGDCVSVIERW